MLLDSEALKILHLRHKGNKGSKKAANVAAFCGIF